MHTRPVPNKKGARGAGTRSDKSILGKHPAPPNPFGVIFSANDGTTNSDVPHRALSENEKLRPATVKCMREMLVKHHASPEALARTQQHLEAMNRLGFSDEQARLRRFPSNESTRKGNLAEVVLAEYVVSASTLSLPVYRLRYNPNIEQSMKGDDVLAFDLDADPVRVIIGESKFRGTASDVVVKDIVDCLFRSHKSGLPASLQFVADRLFDAGQIELGMKVIACAKLFALGKLRLDYVGMLLSDPRAANYVDRSTPASLRRLAMVSLGIKDPNSLVEACFQGLE